MGVGERSLQWIWGSANQVDGADGQGTQSAIQQWLRGACEEGERRLDRVRLRYNLWQDDAAQWDGNGKYTAQISEAIAAYALTKVSIAFLARIPPSHHSPGTRTTSHVRQPVLRTAIQQLHF